MSHYQVSSFSHLTQPPVAVSVHLGWDNPLQGYFLYIECEDENLINEAGLLYDNLADIGLTKDLSYFVEKLIEYQVLVDPDLLLTVWNDQWQPTSNLTKRWLMPSRTETTDFRQFYQDVLKQFQGNHLA